MKNEIEQNFYLLANTCSQWTYNSLPNLRNSIRSLKMFEGSIHLKVKYSTEITWWNKVAQCSCFENVSKTRISGDSHRTRLINNNNNKNWALNPRKPILKQLQATIMGCLWTVFAKFPQHSSDDGNVRCVCDSLHTLENALRCICVDK